MIDFSIIVPVYNRPDEIDELLASLSKQTDKNFEVVVVEDGSTIPCDKIIEKYTSFITINYYFKQNERPAIARNFGMERARGNYFLFFDSDCIIPSDYMANLRAALTNKPLDAFGGPDMASSDFNNEQKAISYALTSFFTTGGIRGGGETISKFYPRSFNMGVSREVFEKTGGFPVIKMHPGEDMVFAIEIIRQGFSTGLVKQAKVYHKRRTKLSQYYSQVFKFGKTRIIISKVYPETFKLFYLLPSVFLSGSLVLLLLSFLSVWFLAPLAFYALVVWVHSTLQNGVRVGTLSVLTAFIQHFGYGMGVLRAITDLYILKKDEYNVLGDGFYPSK